ncbi:unnamed protein product [Amoebophrya sp. A25]|nr:unnamed protein product [Amoebophrya sp. A25]|eukprot:GSA25T00002020001.1
MLTATFRSTLRRGVSLSVMSRQATKTQVGNSDGQQDSALGTSGASNSNTKTTNPSLVAGGSSAPFSSSSLNGAATANTAEQETSLAVVTPPVVVPSSVNESVGLTGVCAGFSRSKKAVLARQTAMKTGALYAGRNNGKTSNMQQHISHHPPEQISYNQEARSNDWCAHDASLAKPHREHWMKASAKKPGCNSVWRSNKKPHQTQEKASLTKNCSTERLFASVYHPKSSCTKSALPRMQMVTEGSYNAHPAYNGSPYPLYEMYAGYDQRGGDFYIANAAGQYYQYPGQAAYDLTSGAMANATWSAGVMSSAGGYACVAENASQAVQQGYYNKNNYSNMYNKNYKYDYRNAPAHQNNLNRDNWMISDSVSYLCRDDGMLNGASLSTPSTSDGKDPLALAAPSYMIPVVEHESTAVPMAHNAPTSIEDEQLQEHEQNQAANTMMEPPPMTYTRSLLLQVGATMRRTRKMNGATDSGFMDIVNQLETHNKMSVEQSALVADGRQNVEFLSDHSISMSTVEHNPLNQSKQCSTTDVTPASICASKVVVVPEPNFTCNSSSFVMRNRAPSASISAASSKDTKTIKKDVEVDSVTSTTTSECHADVGNASSEAEHVANYPHSSSTASLATTTPTTILLENSANSFDSSNIALAAQRAKNKQVPWKTLRKAPSPLDELRETTRMRAELQNDNYTKKIIIGQDHPVQVEASTTANRTKESLEFVPNLASKTWRDKTTFSSEKSRDNETTSCDADVVGGAKMRTLPRSDLCGYGYNVEKSKKTCHGYFFKRNRSDVAAEVSWRRRE